MSTSVAPDPVVSFSIPYVSLSTASVDLYELFSFSPFPFLSVRLQSVTFVTYFQLFSWHVRSTSTFFLRCSVLYIFQSSLNSLFTNSACSWDPIAILVKSIPVALLVCISDWCHFHLHTSLFYISCYCTLSFCTSINTPSPLNLIY